MDIGKEMRVVEVDEPETAPMETERIEDPVEEPAQKRPSPT